MGEIVNLRQARKRRARAEGDAKAAANREKSGASRLVRMAAERLRGLEERRLDGAKLSSKRDDEKSANSRGDDEL